MTGPVVHVGVALVALLLYFDDRYRIYALLLLPLAALPDLDHFVPYAPRLLFHNVFLLVPPLAVAFYGLAARRTVLCGVGLMAGFCLFSHLVLDFFTGGEALFYPLKTTEYALVPWETRVLSRGAVVLLPKSLLPWVSYEVLGIVVCLCAFAGILLAKRLLRFNVDDYERAAL